VSANEIHVGDVGTRLTLVFYDATSLVDISGATTKQLWIRDPSGNCAKVDGNFVSDGTDGQLYYDTLAATFDEAGTWEIQGYIVNPSGTWHSDVKEVKVYANADRA